MDVGIYTPYGPHEVTAAALRVAEHVVHRGRTPRLLASGPIVQGVHPYWDQRVRRAAAPRAVYHWAQGCDSFFWFDHDSHTFSRAQLVASRATQILVPRWHHFPGLDAVGLAAYQRLLCPGDAAKQALLARFAVDPATVGWVCWDSGLNFAPHHPYDLPAQPRLYIPLDNRTSERHAAAIAEVLLILLELFPHLAVTVETVRQWPPAARLVWRELAREYGERLAVHHRTTLFQQLDQFHGHTWTVLFSPRAEFGMTALRSLACGTPVVCHDVQPLAKLVRQYCEGLLVPCELTTDSWGVPTAVFDPAAWVATLTALLEGDDLATTLRAADWQLARRRQVFERCLDEAAGWTGRGN